MSQERNKYKAEFNQYWFNSSLIYIRISLLLTIVLILFFYPFDPYIVNTVGAEFLRFNRIVILVPLMVILLYLSYREIKPQFFYLFASFAFGWGGWIFIYSGFLSPEDSALHVLISLIQTIALLLIALRIPWKFSVPCAVAIYLYASYITIEYININLGTLNAFLTGFGAATSVMCISAFLRDKDSFELFCSQKEHEAAQKEQVEWSKLITRFLRHELSNQITAVTTSVTMIDRTSEDPKVKVFVERARKSIRELRSLLNKTSNATNIDEAVNITDFTEFPVSELLADLLFQYEYTHPNIDFNLDIKHDFKIKGNSTLLNRAIGNIIENAIRHKDEGTAIDIKANENSKIVVTNIGDPLPDDKHALFEMGHSSHQDNKGLFGLGLFIVKKIVQSHGGKVSAHDLNELKGARFEVSLP